MRAHCFEAAISKDCASSLADAFFRRSRTAADVELRRLLQGRQIALSFNSNNRNKDGKMIAPRHCAGDELNENCVASKLRSAEAVCL